MGHKAVRQKALKDNKLPMVHNAHCKLKILGTREHNAMDKTSQDNSTTNLVVAKDIYRDFVLVMKDATFRAILSIGSANLAVATEYDQAVTLAAFGELLQSLPPNVTLQIVTVVEDFRSDSYTNQFQPQLVNPNVSATMKQLIKHHIRHFEELCAEEGFLTREHYAIINYIPKRRGEGSTEAVQAIPIVGGLFRGAAQLREEELPPPEIMEEAYLQLRTYAGLIANGFARMGIGARLMQGSEIIALLRKMYNPGENIRIQPQIKPTIKVRTMEPPPPTTTNPLLGPRAGGDEQQ